MDRQNQETKNQTPIYLALLFLALSLLLLIRLLPALKAPLSAYGYDYGFYLYAVKHAPELIQTSWTGGLWGGFNNPLFLLSGWLHLPASLLLDELYILSAVLLGLSLYFSLRRVKKLAGIFAVLLLAFSLVQNNLYLMFLWKNVVALPFLVLGFKFFTEKKWKPWIACTLVILLTHRTTAIIYALTLALTLAFEQIKQRQYKRLVLEAILGVGALAALWPKLWPIIDRLIHHNNFYVTTGLFMETQNLFSAIWPFLLLAIGGVYLYIKNRMHWLWFIFLALTLLWFLLKLPFYRRIFIYFELGLIFFAAYFLGQISWRKLYLKILLVILLLFLTSRVGLLIMRTQPLIAGMEVKEIQNFQNPGFVLAISAQDAPWLLGYLQNNRLGAPGLFEDPHTYQEWLDFWDNQNQKTFLDFYPKPLYLYQRSYKLDGDAATYLEPLSPNFYQYNCP